MTDTTSQLDDPAMGLDSTGPSAWSATTWFAVVSMAATSFAVSIRRRPRRSGLRSMSLVLALCEACFSEGSAAGELGDALTDHVGAGI
jgi:hypothetical protein